MWENKIKNTLYFMFIYLSHGQVSILKWKIKRKEDEYKNVSLEFSRWKSN